MAKRQDPRHHVHPLVLVELLVRHKPEVPDPEKEQLSQQAQAAGFAEATITDRAKYFRVKLANVTLRRARADARKITIKLLANSVYETFEFLKVKPIQGN